VDSYSSPAQRLPGKTRTLASASVLPYGEPLPYPLPGDVTSHPKSPAMSSYFPLEPDMHFPNPPTLGRSEPCSYGSGKNYKKWCLP
jgi:hypothetical protein